MRVVVHGFGSFPVVFFHVIRRAMELYPKIDWAIILTSNHYEKIFSDLLGSQRVCVYKHENFSDLPPAPELMSSYNGQIFRDIEAQKSTLKNKSASYQVRYAMGMFETTKKFMASFKPDIGLVSQVEGIDGKVFIAAAKSLGADIAVPTGCRNIGGIYFSPNDQETFPDYANADSAECREQAINFLEAFRSNPKYRISAPDVGQDDILEQFLPSLPVRALNALKRWYIDRKNLELITVRVAIQNNLPFIRDLIWRLRSVINGRYNNVSSLDQLPSKYIYYPLQYSPESSINTPAPYFVDQLRAIDAIRFAMPNDTVLVVKEHPACIKTRPSHFVKSLLSRAGVVVARYDLSSMEIIQRSLMTITITGTAALEAFLLRKNALVLGGCLTANFLGGVCGLDKLQSRIDVLTHSDMSEEVLIDHLARLFSIRHDCNFGAPGSSGEPVLRQHNVDVFLSGFVSHCRQVLPQGIG